MLSIKDLLVVGYIRNLAAVSPNVGIGHDRWIDVVHSRQPAEFCQVTCIVQRTLTSLYLADQFSQLIAVDAVSRGLNECTQAVLRELEHDVLRKTVEPYKAAEGQD